MIIVIKILVFRTKRPQKYNDIFEKKNLTKGFFNTKDKFNTI